MRAPLDLIKYVFLKRFDALPMLRGGVFSKTKSHALKIAATMPENNP